MTKLHHLRELIEARLDELYHYLPAKSDSFDLSRISQAKEIYAFIKAYKYVLEQIRELELNKSLFDENLVQWTQRTTAIKIKTWSQSVLPTTPIPLSVGFGLPFLSVW